MPATWTEAYLARIGHGTAVATDAATLRALHERHMLTVPFENLDVAWKRPIVVDDRRFIAKVVDERRGGFCYELNGAFAALLRELGFGVTLLSARVTSAGGGFGPSFDHLALLVHADGRRWLADVGFGDSFLRPLDLDERGEQRDPAGTYRVVDGEEWQMQVLRDGAWQTEYLFTLDPHELDEFAPMCAFHSTSPQSSFTKKRVCTIATADGRITLADAKLIVTRNGVRTETPVDPEQWNATLLERFAIVAP